MWSIRQTWHTHFVITHIGFTWFWCVCCDFVEGSIRIFFEHVIKLSENVVVLSHCAFWVPLVFPKCFCCILCRNIGYGQNAYSFSGSVRSLTLVFPLAVIPSARFGNRQTAIFYILHHFKNATYDYVQLQS